MTFLEGSNRNKSQYRQCELFRKISATATESYVAYLPTSCAKVGKKIDLLFKDEWRRGWTITSVGPCREIETINDSRDDTKRFGWVLGK
jgi:hypothetical protein